MYSYCHLKYEIIILSYTVIFKGIVTVNLMKDTFVEMHCRYNKILSNYYPAHNSTGFTERNLTNNFVAAMERVNGSDCISWFEAPLTDDDGLHVDAVIFDLASKTLFVIEAKRLKSRSALGSLHNDIKRMHNELYISQLEKKISNIKIEKRYAIVLADVWTENNTKLDIFTNWPKCIMESAFYYSDKLGFESLPINEEWKNNYKILIAVDEINIQQG